MKLSKEEIQDIVNEHDADGSGALHNCLYSVPARSSCRLCSGDNAATHSSSLFSALMSSYMQLTIQCTHYFLFAGQLEVEEFIQLVLSKGVKPDTEMRETWKFFDKDVSGL